ncbi:hypothetical protein [Nocardioides pyridinolyticus]
MTTGDRARQAHEELAAALEAVAEHGRVSGRLQRARVAEDDAQRAATEARTRLARETAEVAALESFSPTRIWATLCGRRDTDLDREQAERQAAEYAVARADAWLQSAHDEVRRAEAELAALGDVHARRERALTAVEDALVAAGGPVADDLTRIAGELAGTRSEATEVAEASAAGGHAASRLDAAGQRLGSAGGWATYDTFFGGGLLTDAMKYSHMDEAQRLLHEADQALRRFAAELADVGLQVAVEGLAVDGLARAFDVWFDNIFSDWSVKSRIQEASRRTQEAAHLVAQLRHRLADRSRELADRQVALVAERERLLAG